MGVALAELRLLRQTPPNVFGTPSHRFQTHSELPRVILLRKQALSFALTLIEKYFLATVLA